MLMSDVCTLRSCCDPIRLNSALSLSLPIFGLLLSIHVLMVLVEAAGCRMVVCSSFLEEPTQAFLALGRRHSHGC